MQQRIAIKWFMSRSFEVVVRQEEASAAAAGLAERMSLADSLSLLAGDGMWVGAGGTRFVQCGRAEGGEHSFGEGR